jgi:hypothetical protein
MYIRKIVKDDLTFHIKNVTIHLKKGDVVFSKVNGDSSITVYYGNIELVLHIKKANAMFEHETEFANDIIDEIATRVLEKIDNGKKKKGDDLCDLMQMLF